MKTVNQLCVLISVLFALVFAGCEQKKSSQSTAPVVQSQNILELVGQLDLDNPKQVAAAIEKIALLGPAAESAIPALMRKLGDRNFSVSYGAQKALVKIGPKAARAVVQSNDKVVIGKYPIMLKDFGPAVVPVVIDEVPGTRNPEKLMFMLMAISDMGEPAKAALPMIRKMKSDSTVRPELRALLQIMEVQIEQGKAGVEKLMAESKKGAEDSRKQLDGLHQEFREMVDKAVGFNFSMDPPQAKKLMEGWENDLDKGMPELEIMLASQDKSEKAVACAILFKFCELDEKNTAKALPKIKQLCSDNEKLVRLIASIMAGKLGDTTDYSKYHIESLKSLEDPMEVMFALGGLVQAKTRITDPVCIGTLRALLNSKVKELSLASAIVLLNSGDTERVQSYAESLLLTTDSQTRLNGVALIVKIGPAAQSSISKMRRASELETNEQAKTFIKMAISSLGEAKDDLQGLLEQTKHPERVMRLAAFQKMEQMSSQKKKESIPHLLKLFKEGDADMQMLAISTLCNYKADAEPALPVLMKLLEYGLANQRNDLQFQIASVLGEIGRAEAAPLLFETFRDGDEGAAISASLAIAKLGAKAKAIVPDLLKLAKEPKRTEEALRVLESISVLETDEQKKAVEGFLDEEGGLTSFHAMKILVAQGPEVSAPIFQEAMLSTNRSRNLHGYMGLVEIGKKDPASAIRALELVMEKTSNPKENESIAKTIQRMKDGPAKD